MAGKKKTAANLQMIADSMPVIMRNTIEYHMVKGSDLIAQGHTEEDGVAIDTEVNYKQDMPVKIALNHKNNLKTWFASHGLLGIQIYCTNVKRWDKKQKAEAAGLLIPEENNDEPKKSTIEEKFNKWWDELFK